MAEAWELTLAWTDGDRRLVRFSRIEPEGWQDGFGLPISVTELVAAEARLMALILAAAAKEPEK